MLRRSLLFLVTLLLVLRDLGLLLAVIHLHLLHLFRLGLSRLWLDLVASVLQLLLGLKLQGEVLQQGAELDVVAVLEPGVLYEQVLTLCSRWVLRRIQRLMVSQASGEIHSLSLLCSCLLETVLDRLVEVAVWDAERWFQDPSCKARRVVRLSLLAGRFGTEARPYWDVVHQLP